MNVNLTLDGSPWSGQSVALYQGSSLRYALVGDGTYTSNQVVNGNDDLWVNGEHTDRTVTVNAEYEPQTHDLNELWP